MGKRNITVTTNSGNGTTIDLSNVAYMDKVYRVTNNRHNFGIRFTFHSGAFREIWYGEYEYERDSDFSGISSKI